VQIVEGDEATLGRFHFGVLAAFLLDQVVFDAARGFGRLEDLLPGCYAFTDEHAVTLVRRPVFAVHGANAAGILVYPGYRVIARFKASADI
jgi:hypothetical protein